MIGPTIRSSGPLLDSTQLTCLQCVANRAIVCHVLDALLAAGVEEIAVLAPPDLVPEVAAGIDRDGPPGVDVRYLAHDARTDPYGALRAMARFAGERPAIVHRSDGLLDRPLRPFRELGRADRPQVEPLLVRGARNAEPLGPTARQTLRSTDLGQPDSQVELAGVLMLDGGALAHWRRLAERIEAGGDGLLMTTLLDSLIAVDDREPRARVATGWNAFVGDTLDLLDLNRIVLDSLDLPAADTRQVDGNRFEGRLLIDPTASVRGSVICGPVVIGAGASVADSYVGPHTSIGERACVEGAEIERSIVCAGASIQHLGGRLQTSVVGRDAHIFRDFSVPRAMRMQVGYGDEIALC